MSSITDELKKASKQYDSERTIPTGERIKRFKHLVEVYGVDNVVAATGLKFSSVNQYCQKTNYAVSTSTLLKAEYILGNTVQ